MMIDFIHISLWMVCTVCVNRDLKQEFLCKIGGKKWMS